MTESINRDGLAAELRVTYGTVNYVIVASRRRTGSTNVIFYLDLTFGMTEGRGKLCSAHGTALRRGTGCFVAGGVTECLHEHDSARLTDLSRGTGCSRAGSMAGCGNVGIYIGITAITGMSCVTLLRTGGSSYLRRIAMITTACVADVTEVVGIVCRVAVRYLFGRISAGIAYLPMIIFIVLIGVGMTESLDRFVRGLRHRPIDREGCGVGDVARLGTGRSLDRRGDRGSGFLYLAAVSALALCNAGAEICRPLVGGFTVRRVRTATGTLFYLSRMPTVNITVCIHGSCSRTGSFDVSTVGVQKRCALHRNCQRCTRVCLERTIIRTRTINKLNLTGSFG